MMGWWAKVTQGMSVHQGFHFCPKVRSDVWAQRICIPPCCRSLKWHTTQSAYLHVADNSYTDCYTNTLTNNTYTDCYTDTSIQSKTILTLSVTQTHLSSQRQTILTWTVTQTYLTSESHRNKLHWLLYTYPESPRQTILTLTQTNSSTILE